MEGHDDQETLTPARPIAGVQGVHHADSPYTPTALNVYDASGYASPSPNQATAYAASASASSAMYLSPPLHSFPDSFDTQSAATSQGRSTASPLPSLGELRQLHRANSAAGRLIAMKKLMGEAPPSPTSLQRAGSLGSSTMMESSEMSPSKRRRRVGMLDAPGGNVGDDSLGDDGQEDLFPPSPTIQNFPASSSQPLTLHPPHDPFPSRSVQPGTTSPFPAPLTRPRLGRSNTVANGGGEERRSVIGRRMMLRLGGRVAAQAQAQSQGEGPGQDGQADGDGGEQTQPIRPNPFAVLERRMAAQAQALAQSQPQFQSDEQSQPIRPNPFAALQARLQQSQNQTQVPAQSEREQRALHRAQSKPQLLPLPQTQFRSVSDQGHEGVVGFADSPSGSQEGFEKDQGGGNESEVEEDETQGGNELQQGRSLEQGQQLSSDQHSGTSEHGEHVERVQEDGPQPVVQGRRKSAAEAISLGGAWAPQSHFPQNTSSPPLPSISQFQPMSQAQAHLQPPAGSSLQRSNSGSSILAGAAGAGIAGADDSLARTASRMTARSEMSGGDIFEYEAHLRRSLSERRQGGGGGNGSTRTGATVISAYSQAYGVSGGGEHEGYEAMPEDLREMLVDQGGYAISDGSPTLMKELPVSPERSMARPPPTTPGRFADAEDSSRMSQAQPVSPAEDRDLAPPHAPFTAYDSPTSRNVSQANHAQSPSSSSVNSVNTLDPMARMPFIIPASGINSSPIGRVLAQDRSRMTSMGGESLSNYPGEAVSFSEHGSSGYDPKSSHQDGYTFSSPGTPERRIGQDDEYGSGRGRYRGNESSNEVTPVAFQGAFDRPGQGERTTTDSQWDNDEPTDVATSSKMQKKRSVVLDKVRGAFRRTRSRSRDQDGLVSPMLSPDIDGLEARRSRTESAHSESHTTESDHHHRSVSASRKNSLNASVLSTTPSILPAGQISPLPLAEAGDPRLRNSKLYPSPGVPNLVPPPLLQQVSDSIIPVLQHNIISPSASARSSLNQTSVAAAQAAMAYYDLPPRGQSPVDGATVGKKSWLAEAFFAPTGASFLSKRRPSIPETVHRRASVTDAMPAFASKPPGGSQELNRENNGLSGTSSGVMESNTAPSPLAPSMMNDQRNPRMFGESPTVSTVMELGEDGHSTMYRPASSALSVYPSVDPSPVMTMPGPLGASIMGRPAAKATSQILQRLDSVLALSPDHPDRPDVLDDPPRRLALSTPVLQVVNGHTVKDRHLFLFSDILVIAKPLTADAGVGSLDGHFAVKSVVALQHLSVILPPGEDRGGEGSSGSKHHPVVANFIESFRKDPAAAVAYLEQKSQLQDDPVTLASLLFKSAELDKDQLGRYLSEAGNTQLLRAFVNRFHFLGVRIDEALRTFLLALRLPTEAVASERLLEAFALGWHRVNASSVAFSTALTTDLVLAILQLNDALNPNTGFGYFAFANQVIGVEDFVMAYRTKDTQELVPQTLLEAVYASIRGEKLVQAAKTSEQAMLREVLVTPTRLPSRLTHNSWSERIYISIPEPDAHFGVKLHGEGLLFDPPYLDFTNSTEESFRVMGSTLGVKSMLFSRVGANAPLYSNLPNTKTFSIERSFMRHTFQVSFTNHAGTKRKYCFSVDDAEIREEWINGLGDRIAKVQADRAALSAGAISLKSRLAAGAVALKVLQDTLIPTEGERVTSSGKRKQLPISADRKGSVSARYSGNEAESDTAAATSLSPKTRPGMAHSSSGRRINTLGSLAEDPSGSPQLEHVPATSYTSAAVTEDEPLPPKAQTGKDIVLICRQNSLLPVVLGFLHVGNGCDQGPKVRSDVPIRRTGIQI